MNHTEQYVQYAALLAYKKYHCTRTQLVPEVIDTLSLGEYSVDAHIAAWDNVKLICVEMIKGKDTTMQKVALSCFRTLSPQIEPAERLRIYASFWKELLSIGIKHRDFQSIFRTLREVNNTPALILHPTSTTVGINTLFLENRQDALFWLHEMV